MKTKLSEPVTGDLAVRHCYTTSEEHLLPLRTRKCALEQNIAHHIPAGIRTNRA